MASNQFTFSHNMFGAEGPLIIKGKFQAGSSQAIKQGEILELDSGNFIPLNADQAMSGIIAVAAEEIKAGDLAGYYDIIVPRKGDVFEYPLAAAANPSPGDSLYFSDSETVTTSAGSNVLGNVVDHDGMPRKQNHLSDGGLIDAGTTIGNTSQVRMTFKEAASYFAALQT